MQIMYKAKKVKSMQPSAPGNLVFTLKMLKKKSKVVTLIKTTLRVTLYLCR